MTRLIGSIQETVERERDLQGIIVLTDGNDTAGDRGTLLGTLLAGRKLPVFPVVFGQAGEPKMATVKISSAAPYVRLGDELRLNATLAATNLGEQVVGVRVFEQGTSQPIASRENVRIGKDPINIAFTIKPLSAGRKTYRIAMDGVKDAATSRNARRRANCRGSGKSGEGSLSRYSAQRTQNSGPLAGARSNRRSCRTFTVAQGRLVRTGDAPA